MVTGRKVCAAVLCSHVLTVSVGRDIGLYAYIYVLCMYMSMLLTVYTWRSEDMEVRASLLLCGSGNKFKLSALVTTQVVSLAL